MSTKESKKSKKDKGEDLRTFIWTPIGEYLFPALFVPDNFKGKDNFKVDLKLDMNNSDVQKLMEALDATAEKGEAMAREAIEARTDLPPDDKEDKLRKLDVKKGYTKEYKDGDYTGNIILKLKMRGDIVGMKPKVWDPQGCLYPGPVDIWSGSTGRLKVSYAPFFADSGLCGTTLKLYEAQLKTRRGPGMGDYAGDGPEAIGSAEDTPASQPSDEKFESDEEVKPQGGF
jgi:hypothetical protein